MDPLSDDLRQAMDQALTEVERQVRRLAWGELIEQGTDLEWSFNGPDRWSLFIEALRQGHNETQAVPGRWCGTDVAHHTEDSSQATTTTEYQIRLNRPVGRPDAPRPVDLIIPGSAYQVRDGLCRLPNRHPHAEGADRVPMPN